MQQVTIYPGGMILHVEAGTPVRELLVREGLLVDFPCGGRGLCSQCRVEIDPPPESGKKGRNPLPDKELARGVRLACQAVVEGDCTITIPEDKDVKVVWKDPAATQTAQLLYGEPVVGRRALQLTAPSLEDQRSDWERLRAGMDPDVGMPAVTPEVAEGFSHTLRHGGWKAEAFLDAGQLICLLPSSEHPVYGFAIDLGTTTVDISLHNLDSGGQTGRRALLNKQTAFGADVISRAQAFHDDRDRVRRAALETIQECAQSLLEEAGVSAERVIRSAVVGNPIMIHILHGLDARQLTLAPYVPLVSGMVRRPPADFGWSFQSCGFVETLPLISAFVGADTVGMILALDLEHDQGTSLSIDIGTNGEIVLARAGELITTSTAAGPAFEGAQISCGMRALKGAITGLTIEDGGGVHLQVVGGGPAKGICGSGLISGIAGLLEAGLLDKSGRLSDPDEVEEPGLRERLFRTNNHLAFMLDQEQNVYISQKDIRELQLAKGAIRTGIDLLLHETGVDASQLDRIRLAGNFGSGVDIAATMRLGLIPEIPIERVDVVGNAALRGASLVLVSKEYRERSCNVFKKSRFLELAARPDFQLKFAESMFFTSRS
jgi:uncharacterized 2Fe-2S/4Fe-4S cluster protein (DUF4445 family)